MKRIYSFSKEELKDVKNLISFDPYAQNLPMEKIEEMKKNDELFDVIFVRQGVEIREGKEFGKDYDYLLVVDAPPEFFEKAEKKLERIKSLKRLKKEEEEEIAKKIEEQAENAEKGFGAIFGE
jgi:pyruvate/2-oxoacid:ferredoxin oxidoreductase beta subunit